MPTEQKTHAQIYEAAKDELVRDIALLINRGCDTRNATRHA